MQMNRSRPIIKRLIRTPGSLHGGSGMRVVPLDLHDLEDFDPLVDAVVFGDSKTSSWKGALGSSVAKVFDLTVAATGVNEKTLIRLAKAHKSVIIHPNSHAGYYPNALPMSLK